jgi:hypothetical protein
LDYILSTLDQGCVPSAYEYLVISPSIRWRSIGVTNIQAFHLRAVVLCALFSNYD